MPATIRHGYLVASALCALAGLAIAPGGQAQTRSGSAQSQQATREGERSTATQADATAAMRGEEAVTGDDFTRIDADHDGRISGGEAADAGLGARFKALDADGDGYLSSSEFHAGLHADQPTRP